MTEAKHPIIALWAHPRSMSTATERIMRERGDCTVFHEPFLADYYVHRAVRELPMLELGDESLGDEKPRDYDAVCHMILEAARDGPVFFKDMSYYVVPRIFDDRGFAGRLVNLFLIRDPRRAIASYHKLDPDVTLAEIGIEAQWRHASFLKDALGREPLVIEAEAVQADAVGVLSNLWQKVGLPFVAEAFDWSAETVPADWKYVEGWHGDAKASQGIRQSSDDARAVFQAAARNAPHLKDYLAHHLPFYERLKGFALTHKARDPERR